MNGHGHHHGQDHGHGDHHHIVFDTPEMVAHAELEGEVLAGLFTQATERLARVAEQRGLTVERVLDIGSGPGVGTCLLAERFPDADLVAADGAATMLDGVASRADRLGLADRISTRQIELPDGLGDLDRADVVWASLVLHHVGDETDALRRIAGLLEPGGLLALVERAGPVRVLPADTDGGRPGLWARLDAAQEEWFAGMRAELPGATTSDDYPVMLAAAGLELVVEELVSVTLEPPLDERARRFARLQLERTRQMLDGHADPDDLAALDRLIAAEAPATIHASRHLYLAVVQGP